MRTNEAPVVIYEQMSPGHYTFTLQVWTSSGDYSRDSVNVFVHAPYSPLPPPLGGVNTSTSLHNNSTTSLKAAKTTNTSALVANSTLQLELAIEPALFTEAKKDEFLSQLQSHLHRAEFNLLHPRLVLLDTRVAFKESRASGVLLQLIVFEQLDDQADTYLMDTRERVYDERESWWSSTSGNGNGNGERAVAADTLARLMRASVTRQQLADYVWSNVIGLDVRDDANQLLLAYLTFADVRVVDIRPLACSDACLAHGRCDPHSHACVCDQYWTSDLYKAFVANQQYSLSQMDNCGQCGVFVHNNKSECLKVCIFIFIFSRVEQTVDADTAVRDRVLGAGGERGGGVRALSSVLSPVSLLLLLWLVVLLSIAQQRR